MGGSGFGEFLGAGMGTNAGQGLDESNRRSYYLEMDDNGLRCMNEPQELNGCSDSAVISNG